MKKLLSTREVAEYLGVNEKMVYTLVAEKGLTASKIAGYHHEVNSHMEVGLEVLSGRADMGPGIKPVAGLLGLDFIPLRWERYDLLVTRDRFFDKPVQYFLGILQDAEFKNIAGSLEGYDISAAGRMLYSQDAVTV